jgi:hypothetical protein
VTDFRNPHITGFLVPPLVTSVDVRSDGAIVAMLDRPPSELWVSIFRREVAGLQGAMGIADIRIEGAEILFFGSLADARGLANKVRELVDRITKMRFDERAARQDAEFTDGTGGAQTSFDRND